MNNQMIADILTDYIPQTKMYFRGVFTLDNFVDRYEEFLDFSSDNLFIINTATKEELNEVVTGYHWLLVCLEGRRGRVIFFDSFGKNPSDYDDVLNETLDNLSDYTDSALVKSPYRIQNNNSKLCGIYCIFIAEQLFRGLNNDRRRRRLPNQLNDIIIKYFSANNFDKNDRFVYNWFKKQNYAEDYLKKSCSSKSIDCLSYNKLFP